MTNLLGWIVTLFGMLIGGSVLLLVGLNQGAGDLLVPLLIVLGLISLPDLFVQAFGTLARLCGRCLGSAFRKLLQEAK